MELIKDDLMKCELSIREIFTKYRDQGISRAMVEQGLFILGIDRQKRAEAVRAEKSRQAVLQKFDLEALKRDLDDLTILNYDLGPRHNCSYHMVCKAAEALGVNMSERKERTREATAERYCAAKRKDTYVTWLHSSMTGDGLSLKWLSKKW